MRVETMKHGNCLNLSLDEPARVREIAVALLAMFIFLFQIPARGGTGGPIGSTYNETLAASKYRVLPTKNSCGDFKPNPNYYGGTGDPEYQHALDDWQDCDLKFAIWRLAEPFAGGPVESIVPRGAKSSIHTAAARGSPASGFSLALSSSTPSLPFLGNRLAIISYVLNAGHSERCNGSFPGGSSPSIRLQPGRGFSAAGRCDT